MGSVVEFKKPVARNEMWAQGSAVCIGCRHEWEAVAPVGTHQLECPKCHTMKGIFRHPFGSAPGDSVFQCNCGCEAMTAYFHKGKFWFQCMSCGIDHTDAIFD